LFPLVAVPLTQRHRQTHAVWAITHLHWTQRQWNTVLFTVNFRFQADFADGRAVLGEDELSGFIPKTSFNKTAMVVVVP
jgi:hypothetical protein